MFITNSGGSIILTTPCIWIAANYMVTSVWKFFVYKYVLLTSASMDSPEVWTNLARQTCLYFSETVSICSFLQISVCSDILINVSTYMRTTAFKSISIVKN